jgi:hypothetical protein
LKYFPNIIAESVADVAQRPLYPVTAGDLGVEAASVEQNLTEALQLATKWNAVVLIDEADVFLEQRGAHDLERNSLVSGRTDTLSIHRSTLTRNKYFSASSNIMKES